MSDSNNNSNKKSLVSSNCDDILSIASSKKDIINENSYTNNSNDSNACVNEKILKSLNSPGNNECSDCFSRDTQYINLIFGIVICVKCYERHFNFFFNLQDKLKKIDSNNFTIKESNILEFSGNNKFATYIYEYGVRRNEMNLKIKYLNKAALYYKDFVENLSEGKVIEKKRPSIDLGLEPIYVEELGKRSLIGRMIDYVGRCFDMISLIGHDIDIQIDNKFTKVRELYTYEGSIEKKAHDEEKQNRNKFKKDNNLKVSH